MKKIILFLAEGFEEIEAIATLDILRRANLDVQSVSISEELMVTGGHKLAIRADLVFEDVNFAEVDMIILPGGMPGTKNLGADARLKEKLVEHAKSGKQLAAICAAPRILGQLGLLVGIESTCYPGNESLLTGAKLSEYMVVEDGNIITASGPSVAIDFALQIVQSILGEEKAEEISRALLLS